MLSYSIIIIARHKSSKCYYFVVAGVDHPIAKDPIVGISSAISITRFSTLYWIVPR